LDSSNVESNTKEEKDLHAILICHPHLFHRQNLDLNKELNDKVAEGRTLGNIGNVNYLLQEYSTSIEYLDKVDRRLYSV
jgi:NRPS condensation-like uncharacterized protein